MAERRMFAKTIIDSDAFLDMPLSTQALYFHLGMRADDDGFVNSPRKIQRLTNCSDDDLKLLIAKNFIIPFESGVVVIKHWKIHNYIRSDRYKATTYTEEKAELTVKDNGAYSLTGGRYTIGIPSDIPVGDAGKDRLGKDRLGKDSIDSHQLDEEFESLWAIYPKKQGKKKAKAEYIRARKNGTTYEAVEQGIFAYKHYIEADRIEDRYIKHGSTFFTQQAWEDDWSVKEKRYNNAKSNNPFMDMLENGDY